MGRGRKPKIKIDADGQTEGDNNNGGTIIEDELLNPYYIRVETNCFTVFKKGSPIMEGCFTDLANALKKIAQIKMASQNVVATISQYIGIYKELVNKFTSLI